jgi:hypothetical protein
LSANVASQKIRAWLCRSRLHDLSDRQSRSRATNSGLNSTLSGASRPPAAVGPAGDLPIRRPGCQPGTCTRETSPAETRLPPRSYETPDDGNTGIAALRIDGPVQRKNREEYMLRAIVTLLVLGLVGMTVLSLLFGVLMPLLVIAVKVALVLVVGYFILRLVSPTDAEKVRDKLNGYCNKSD